MKITNCWYCGDGGFLWAGTSHKKCNEEWWRREKGNLCTRCGKPAIEKTSLCKNCNYESEYIGYSKE